jgi:hypothetical protein
MILPEDDEIEINLQPDQTLLIKLPGYTPDNPICLTVHLDGPQLKMFLTGPYVISKIHEDIRQSGYSQGLLIAAHEMSQKRFTT